MAWRVQLVVRPWHGAATAGGVVAFLHARNLRSHVVLGGEKIVSKMMFVCTRTGDRTDCKQQRDFRTKHGKHACNRDDRHGIFGSTLEP